jgi:stage II sporulation protein D
MALIRNVFLSLMLPLVGSPVVLQATPNPDLAVAIRRGVERAVLSATRGFLLRDMVRDNTIIRWNSSDPLSFQSTVNGIQIGRLGVFSQVSVEPLIESTLAVDGSRFRGRFRVEEDNFGRLNVINLVDVESYLKGVIPAEMLISSHMEALKAQAVVARTFALKQLLKSTRRDGYDLTADTASQVYHGIGGESPRSSQAVEDTRGSVLHAGTHLLDAFYHQACGGRTQNNEDVWGGRALPHLRAVNCSYCAEQYTRQGFGNYHWTHRISFTDLRIKLLEQGIQIAEILDVRQSLEECGRAASFAISSSSDELELSSAKLREILGTSILRSSFYRLATEEPARELASGVGPPNPLAEANIRSIIGSYLRNAGQRFLEFEGTGSGHGVGLCQWGARRQAEMGRDHEGILHYYYRKVSVGPLLPEITGD